MPVLWLKIQLFCGIIALMKPEDNIQKFIEQRAIGKSFKEISESLNVPVDTLVIWAKKSTLDISNQKAVEIDALSSRYSVTKSRRIELMGNIVDKLQKELDTRDYKEIPTDKLFDYLLKYTSELKKEYEAPVFKEIISGMDPSTWETQVTWTG